MRTALLVFALLGLFAGAALLLLQGVTEPLMGDAQETLDSRAAVDLTEPAVVERADTVDPALASMGAPPQAPAWWEDPARVSELQSKWSDVHAWNVEARIREINERGLGTKMLKEALVLSGVLLEEIRLRESDFEEWTEAEKMAAASCLQQSASNRMKLGEDPFLGLTPQDADRLRSKILEKGLEHPPEYLARAAAGDHEGLAASTRAAIARLRVDYLRCLAPLMAEKAHRETTALHLLDREGLISDYRPSKHLRSLDPEYQTLLFEIQDLNLRYRDEVTQLLQQ